MLNKPLGAGVFMSANWGINGVNINATDGLDTLNRHLDTLIYRKVKELQPMVILSRDIVIEDNPYVYKRF